MKVIAHRRNTIADLKATPPQYGVEIDVRTIGHRLVLQHDAFADGDDLEAWLAHYRHGTLILNVKEEGLEQRLMALMDERGIADYFFLDQSFPFLIKTARLGERRCAVRVSEFEHVETALNLAGMIDWVWVDCFSRFPLSRVEAERLKHGGFRLCVVSPELQGRDGDAISAMRMLLQREGIAPDAVCTKKPELWQD